MPAIQSKACVVCGFKYARRVKQTNPQWKRQLTCSRICANRYIAANNVKHGLSRSAEYSIWHQMNRRCHDRGNHAWRRYGGRGIFVCEEWRTSFDQFLRDMGRRPGPSFTVDRIDNDGPYSPSNCRWATRYEQAQNRCNSIKFTIDGQTKTAAQWADHFGVNRDTVYWRIEKGLPVGLIFERK